MTEEQQAKRIVVKMFRLLMRGFFIANASKPTKVELREDLKKFESECDKFIAQE